MTTAHSRRPRRTTTAQPGPRRTVGRPAGRPGATRPRPAQFKVKEQRRRQAQRRARRAAIVWSAAALAAGALVISAVLVTRASPLQHTIDHPAPGFTLTATNGKTVSLASYRGHDVVLYFNEGAGCDACFYQMRQFEQHAAQLRRAGITIVPIVMNPASQIRPELASFGLRTPYLIDASGRYRAPTARWARECTPACPATASSSSTPTAPSGGTASTRPCTCPPPG